MELFSFEKFINQNESMRIDEKQYVDSKSMENLIDLEKAGSNPSDFLNYFDGFYVINLDKRKDRLEAFSKQMKESGVKDFVRVQAYDGEKNLDKVLKDPKYLLDKYSDICDISSLKSPDPNRLKRECGVYACAESHRTAVLQAKADGCKRPLILEDDSCPTKALFYRGTSVIDELKDIQYDLLNLGIVRMKFHEERGIFKGSTLIRKLYKGTPTKFHAYSVDPRFYDDYIQYSLKNWDWHIDIQVMSQALHKGKDVYAVHPRMFTQLGDFSDLRQKKIKKGGLDEIAFRFPHQAKRDDSYW
jgi:GR25 family glycosyltransferase involved in LPS biosynthesis